MKFIYLNQFLDLYKDSPADKQTLIQFINSSEVVVGNKKHKLSDYMERKNISRSFIEELFSNIKNRNKYLTGFYNLSLRVSEQHQHIHTAIKPMLKSHMDNNNGIIFKNMIRNLHMMDILKNTSSGLENTPTFLVMLDNLYRNNIIDYKILTPSALDYMHKGRLGSVFSSFYFRASIMNPYLVYSLNMKVLKGTKIFTPTLGWSSYAFGFLECPDVIEYVGTDVIKSVCNKTDQLCSNYQQKHDIYCCPSEDLLTDKKFIKKYREHFDVVFFSPPYYRLELYKSENQSTSRYKDYKDWLEKYWEATIKLCHTVLENKGKLCYILSGYGSQNTNNEYDLLDDMNKITAKYFKSSGKQPMHNKDVHSTKHRETGEQIMYFVKK